MRGIKKLLEVQGRFLNTTVLKPQTISSMNKVLQRRHKLDVTPKRNGKAAVAVEVEAEKIIWENIPTLFDALWEDT